MNRKRIWIAVTILLVLGAPRLGGAERGITVKARLPSSGEWVTLYDRSWAVVIGIDQYEHWPGLAHAVGDARAVSVFLRDQGFTVFELYDRDVRPDSGSWISSRRS